VAPELKSQISAGKIDLTAIVNTHQYVVNATPSEMNIVDTNYVATGTMLGATIRW
jgi:hypothetical protein